MTTHPYPARVLPSPTSLPEPFATHPYPQATTRPNPRQAVLAPDFPAPAFPSRPFPARLPIPRLTIPAPRHSNSALPDSPGLAPSRQHQRFPLPTAHPEPAQPQPIADHPARANSSQLFPAPFPTCLPPSALSTSPQPSPTAHSLPINPLRPSPFPTTRAFPARFHPGPTRLPHPPRATCAPAPIRSTTRPLPSLALSDPTAPSSPRLRRPAPCQPRPDFPDQLRPFPARTDGPFQSNPLRFAPTPSCPPPTAHPAPPPAHACPALSRLSSPCRAISRRSRPAHCRLPEPARPSAGPAHPGPTALPATSPRHLHTDAPFPVSPAHLLPFPLRLRLPTPALPAATHSRLAHPSPVHPTHPLPSPDYPLQPEPSHRISPLPDSPAQPFPSQRRPSPLRLANPRLPRPSPFPTAHPSPYLGEHRQSHPHPTVQKGHST